MRPVPKRRKHRGETLDIELEQPLRPLHVLEPVLTDFVEAHAVQTEVLDDPGRRIGHQRLAAVRDRADPRGPVDAHSDVALVVEKRLRSVKAHANSKASFARRLSFVEGSLPCGRRVHRVGSALEDNEEAIPRRVDLDSAVIGKRLTEDPSVLAP